MEIERTIIVPEKNFRDLVDLVDKIKEDNDKLKKLYLLDQEEYLKKINKNIIWLDEVLYNYRKKKGEINELKKEIEYYKSINIFNYLKYKIIHFSKIINKKFIKRRISYNLLDRLQSVYYNELFIDVSCYKNTIFTNNKEDFSYSYSKEEPFEFICQDFNNGKLIKIALNLKVQYSSFRGQLYIEIISYSTDDVYGEYRKVWFDKNDKKNQNKKLWN